MRLKTLLYDTLKILWEKKKKKDFILAVENMWLLRC